MSKSNQQRVQTEPDPGRPKKRKDMSTEERLQLLQRKLYLKAKQDRKSQRKSRMYGQHAFDILVKKYGLINPYRTCGFRPVYA